MIVSAAYNAIRLVLSIEHNKIWRYKKMAGKSSHRDGGSLHEVKDPAKIKKTSVDFLSGTARISNTCSFTVYVHIEWPYGGVSNATIAAGDYWDIYIGTGGDPCGCFSSSGVITDCGDRCTPISGGYIYTTC